MSECGSFTLGLDLEGVLRNRNILSSRLALELFGADISPERMHRDSITSEAAQLAQTGVPLEEINRTYNLVTRAQYRQVQSYLSETGALDQAPVVCGAAEGLSQIRKTCQDVKLDLSALCLLQCAKATAKYARHWLKKHPALADIRFGRILGSANTAEGVVRAGCDAFISDSASHLKNLGIFGIRGFLLDYQYNRCENEQVEYERLPDWPSLAERLCAVIGEYAEKRTISRTRKIDYR